MGLLKHLLFWPVTGPGFLIDFSMGKVQDVVREELTDDAPVKSALLELQLQLELGDIDDDEYVRREAELMQQLREIREWREQFGMGVAGGPVRVRSAEESGSDQGGQVIVSPSDEEPEPAGPSAGRQQPGIIQPGEARIEFDLDWDG